MQLSPFAKAELQAYVARRRKQARQNLWRAFINWIRGKA